ncbi:hypothetical protein YC2023_079184 [Brassica napus]
MICRLWFSGDVGCSDLVSSISLLKFCGCPVVSGLRRRSVSRRVWAVGFVLFWARRFDGVAEVRLASVHRLCSIAALLSLLVWPWFMVLLFCFGVLSSQVGEFGQVSFGASSF